MFYLKAKRAVRLHFRAIRAGKSTWIKFMDIRSSFLIDWFCPSFYLNQQLWDKQHHISPASDILFLKQIIAINQLIDYLSVSKIMVDL